MQLDAKIYKKGHFVKDQKKNMFTQKNDQRDHEILCKSALVVI